MMAGSESEAKMWVDATVVRLDSDSQGPFISALLFVHAVGRKAQSAGRGSVAPGLVGPNQEANNGADVEEEDEEQHDDADAAGAAAGGEGGHKAQAKRRLFPSIRQGTLLLAYFKSAPYHVQVVTEGAGLRIYEPVCMTVPAKHHLVRRQLSLHSTDVGIFDPSRLLLCSEVLEPLMLPDAPTYARDAAKRIVPIGADTGTAAGKVKKKRGRGRAGNDGKK
jgi:hypothetical protein